MLSLYNGIMNDNAAVLPESRRRRDTPAVRNSGGQTENEKQERLRTQVYHYLLIQYYPTCGYFWMPLWFKYAFATR